MVEAMKEEVTAKEGGIVVLPVVVVVVKFAVGLVVGVVGLSVRNATAIVL